MSAKRIWQEPVVRTIEQLAEAQGITCNQGSTATGGGATQCHTGNFANQDRCALGLRPVNTCSTGVWVGR